MPLDGDFRFGPYRLDPRGQRLLRHDVVVPLQRRPFHVLRCLVERAGDLVTKEQLIEEVWKGTAVADASLTQAVYHLRRVLDPDHASRYIETVAGTGYRFVEHVSRVTPRKTDDDVEALLAPYRALVDGRAAIELLVLAEIARAQDAFGGPVERDPDQATFHVGLAMACVLHNEATRTDAVPDRAALDRALWHAREACRLSDDYGEAWATLGFVLGCAGDHAAGVVALQRSTALEPDNWRHHLRLAFVGWGQVRLGAARRTLKLFPACAMARWLAATVHVARAALPEAEREVDAAIAVSDPEDEARPGRFAVVALHWLKGLLCLGRGADDEALAHFERELALEPRGHVYAREVAANTWYAIGACRWRQGDRDRAREAFREAIARVPRHPMALAGLELCDSADDGRQPLTGANTVLALELAMAYAVVMVGRRDHTTAAALVAPALLAAPEGSAGWIIPIEPMLDVSRAPDVWAIVVGRVGKRAG